MGRENQAVADVGLQLNDIIEKSFPAATEVQLLECLHKLNKNVPWTEEQNLLRNRRLSMAFETGSEPQNEPFYEWLSGDRKTPRW
jgi:hypothetical protein